MYHDVVIVIIPLDEPEATGRRRPLQVMELALARIGADEAVGLDHLAPKANSRTTRSDPSHPAPVIRIRPTVDFPLIWLTKGPSAA